MTFIDFSLRNRDHAFLSPSSAKVWLGQDRDYLKKKLESEVARFIGTKKHEMAADDITLRMKRPDNGNSFNMYVNDAIGYRMDTEVKLEYSKWCHGTADALVFRDGLLRIHDLKTGSTKTSMAQLIVYAALYCLKHDIDPSDIQIELRIYQSDDILISNPTVEDIAPVMDKIITFDRIINDISKEEE